MRFVAMTLLFLFIFDSSCAQCDLGTNGISVVNATNTAQVTGACVGTLYHLKFNIVNFGPACSLPANTVFAYIAFPTISGGIKPYIYSGPPVFVSGYFTWTYDNFFEQLVGVNTTALPAGAGDASVLVPVLANAVGTATCPLNLSSGPNSNSNLGNDNASVQLSVNLPINISDQPNQQNCNNGSFTMAQTAPALGTGAWALQSGTANIIAPASPVTTVTGVPVGSSATIRWTVTNGSCSVYDDVTLTNKSVATVSVSGITSNNCHGGSNGSISVTGGGGSAPYNFSIAGPTVNSSGQISGVFSSLAAGNYTITVSTLTNCSSSTSALVTEPAGTLPDISLGSDYNSNFFPANADECNIIYNVAEIAGNPSTGDTIRIVRVPGYTFSFDVAATTTSIGSVVYALDNNRWKLDNSAPAFISLVFDPVHNNSAGTIPCKGKLLLALKFRRNTPNSSTFNLSARLRKSDNEENLMNNSNSVLFIAE